MKQETDKDRSLIISELKKYIQLHDHRENCQPRNTSKIEIVRQVRHVYR